MSKKSGAKGNTSLDADYIRPSQRSEDLEIEPTVEDALSEEPDQIEDPQSGPTATEDTPSYAKSEDVRVT